MEKRIIYDTLFHKTFGQTQPTWKELKDLGLQDDDIVTISFEEPYHSENNSYDGHWFIDVLRPRLETDEELKERMNRTQLRNEELKKNRYETYLKLKQEFEG